jgi:localization factor PodJL
VADRRTQETLKAVHETLEQIVNRLAELEADDGPDGEDPGLETSSKLAEQPDGEAAEEAAGQAAGETAAETARDGCATRWRKRRDAVPGRGEASRGRG